MFPLFSSMFRLHIAKTVELGLVSGLLRYNHAGDYGIPVYPRVMVPLTQKKQNVT